MTETEKRKHRVCFTGHRPEKLSRCEKDIKRTERLYYWHGTRGGYLGGSDCPEAS